ncbi:MAG: GTP cyclohydrolase II [Blastocatellia bacterium]|nr:GTP cyclohydrolase II [Blastocatellia bacterium]MBK6428676.1 GTP cyclohydrolase II [Blastocatellia bacterium]
MSDEVTKRCTAEEAVEPECRPSQGALTVERVAEASLPTEHGEFRIIGYRSMTSDEEFVAVAKGELSTEEPTLVRIHSQCLTGDVFHSLRCDCGQQLTRALELVEEAGRGVIVYQQQEGRGIGILNKIRAYALQEQGQDTVEANLSLGFAADQRTYQQCAEILFDLGLCKVIVMSNNPQKIAALERAGLNVVDRKELDIQQYESFANYLRTKREKMGHIL